MVYDGLDDGGGGLCDLHTLVGVATTTATTAGGIARVATTMLAGALHSSSLMLRCLGGWCWRWGSEVDFEGGEVLRRGVYLRGEDSCVDGRASRGVEGEADEGR